MIRLLLADDQALIRGALASLLELEQDLTVVAQVGRGDEVVAAELFLSPGTVRNHLSSAIGKTHTTTRTEAVRAARAAGWL